MKSLEKIKDWNDVQEHLMLGEILIESEKITLSELGLALDVQKFQQEKLRLGDILLSSQMLSEDDLKLALELQKSIDEMIAGRKNEL